jgi:hypothetical protein
MPCLTTSSQCPLLELTNSTIRRRKRCFHLRTRTVKESSRQISPAIRSHLFGRIMSYDVSYGVISSSYAGTAPAAAELSGKVTIFLLPASSESKSECQIHLLKSRPWPGINKVELANQLLYLSISFSFTTTMAGIRRSIRPEQKRLICIMFAHLENSDIAEVTEISAIEHAVRRTLGAWR